MLTVAITGVKTKQEALCHWAAAKCNPPSRGNHRLTGHPQSACRDFTAHCNLMYFNSSIWKVIYSIKESPTLLFTTILFSLKDEIWQESNALIIPCKLITNSQLAAGTAKEYKKLQFLQLNWKSRGNCQGHPIKDSHGNMKKPTGVYDQSELAKMENYHSYRNSVSCISSTAWDPSRALPY